MNAPRFLAALAAVAACLFVQACSDSNDSEDADAGKPAKMAPGPQRGPLPAAPSTTPELKPVDACTLLTAQEVSTVIGHAMEGPAAGSTAGGGKGEGKMNSCSFASRSKSKDAAPAELLAELNTTWFVTVTVWVWPEDGGGARNYMNAMRDAPMAGEPVREIGELGDEAVWNGTLHARKENVTVSLDVRAPKGAENPDELKKERALMEHAIKRL